MSDMTKATTPDGARAPQAARRTEGRAAASPAHTRLDALQSLVEDSPPVQRMKALGDGAAPVQRESVIDEANRGYTHKSELSPQGMADSLTTEVQEFADLRGAADAETQEQFGKPLGYKTTPKGQVATSAHFKEGQAYFARNAALGQTLSNIIFETANAAQSGRFAQVESDYNSGALLTKAPTDYGVTDLPADLADEYRLGDGATRRSLLQERMEYDSLMMSAPAIRATFAKLTDETARVPFDLMIDFLDMDFAAYYEARGKAHRSLVENAIRAAEAKEPSWWQRICYLTTACVEARGLSDDCAELRVLRAFRDGYMMDRLDGPKMIVAYYDRAPAILSALKARPDAADRLEGIYATITTCVALIEAGAFSTALARYRRMVEELEEDLLPPADAPTPG